MKSAEHAQLAPSFLSMRSSTLTGLQIQDQPQALEEPVKVPARSNKVKI